MLALTSLTILQITLDLPGLENHKPWVQALGITAMVTGVAFTIVLSLGFGRKPRRTADWWRLKVCTEEITSVYQPIIRAKAMNSGFSPNERAMWLAAIRRLLDSQIENPILLENDPALTRWRRAQTNARMAADLESSGVYDTDPNLFFGFAEGIVKEVLEVALDKVIFSDEPGAPNPASARTRH